MPASTRWRRPRGGAIGAATSLALFTALIENPTGWLDPFMQGRTDNVALREAAFYAIGLTVVFLVLAALAALAIPKGKLQENRD
ncbi:hypothetical protein JSY14_06435 [Brachybacterium sp. EF45031]|uniref:hypothetical protein n=1 Tax=Brachybacterium sillae TaxID=2810536 RepID=UPI00217EB3B6|nr:hypothetical protein [Brachybacterium sillae]MCS6711676.1 hypothetical protein [Brachybacterium sillae]